MAQDIKKQISDILLKAEGEIGTALNFGLEETAQEVAAKTRANALALWPDSDTGYPTNWKYKKDKFGYVVYNEKTYQLAHLLEHGHRIVVNGKYSGKDTKKKPHIPTDEEVDKTTTENVERRLNEI